MENKITDVWIRNTRTGQVVRLQAGSQLWRVPSATVTTHNGDPQEGCGSPSPIRVTTASCKR